MKPPDPEAERQARERALQKMYLETAEEYYLLANTLLGQERELNALVEQVEQRRRRVVRPGRAIGVVMDRRNRAVDGAAVMITGDKPDMVIGRGKTDPGGRFDIPLYTTAYTQLTLHVIANGCEKYVHSRFVGGITQWRARMDPEVNRRFMERLTGSGDPRERLWQALDLVGARGTPVPVESVFPFIGNLRPELLRIVSIEQFSRKDDLDAAPADRALEFLAFWQDDEDRPLIGERLPKVRYTFFKKTVFAGGSPEEACLMWGEAFFARTDLDPRPVSRCGRPLYSFDRKRALIDFNIFEPYRSYRHLLLTVDRGRGWELLLAKTE